jgi:hypothetical protein
METGYKAFKVSLPKSIQVEEQRFGVEPEIVAKVSTVASAEADRLLTL